MTRYKLTPATREELRARARSGENSRDLAAEYGISLKTVHYHKTRTNRARPSARVATLRERADDNGRVMVLFSDGHICPLGPSSNRYAGEGALVKLVAFPVGWRYRGGVIGG